MKIVAISDIHGDFPLELPDGDVLVIAGDILPDDYHPTGALVVGTTRMIRQGWWFNERFIPWLRLKRLQFATIIFIGGNHDFFFEAVGADSIRKDLPDGVHYLCESDVTIDGVKFYGAGWNCTTGWAFYLDHDQGYEEKLRLVPQDVDVLVVHGPPEVDGMPGFHYCSPRFGDWAEQQTDMTIICGHIHEAYGTYHRGTTPVHVVSVKNRRYELVNPPTELHLQETPLT